MNASIYGRLLKILGILETDSLGDSIAVYNAKQLLKKMIKEIKDESK